MDSRLKHGLGVLMFMLIGFTAFALNHEYTHWAIAQEYGCPASIDATPSITENNSYVMQTTIDLGDCNLSKYEYSRMSWQQDTVEATGYQLSVPVLLLSGILYFVIMIWRRM